MRPLPTRQHIWRAVRWASAVPVAFQRDRLTVTPSAQLQAVLALLEDIDHIARPADAIVSSWFRTRRRIEDRDRGAILERLYELLRHRARLGWCVERAGGRDTARNRLLAWLVLVEGKTPEQIKRLFDGPKGEASGLTAREYALMGALKGGTISHSDMPEAVRLECPDWALDPLRRRFGGAFAREMMAALAPPTLDLRVNTVATTREAVLRELADLGFSAEGTKLAPDGIRLRERISLARLAPLKRGDVEIQDEGSQLVAMLVDARPGERVVDFCAGACGKTLAIAAQMRNKGHIVACDVNEGRLKRGAERLRHAKVQNTETKLLSSETDRWVKRHKGGFDRVLVDAPCSGTGTWRRNPDARWRAPEEKGLENLLALQARILASVARLVKPGGRLVYATCSMLPEENEQQVAAFLAGHSDFRVLTLKDVAPRLAAEGQDEYLSLTPAQHDTDGFFAAVLQREDVLSGSDVL